MTDFVLAIDSGTTGTTAAIFDSSGSMRAKVNQEFRQIFPEPGWVEHDLEDIWTSATDTILTAIEKAKIEANQIKAIGITNQRETTGVWDRQNGKPLHNAIVWQCRRTTDLCNQLKDQGHESLFKERTGLVLDPYFSGTKLRWLLDNVADLRPRAQKGEVCFGTIDTYLVYKLTGHEKHITDVSNASRTLMMNLETLEWDEQLLDILEIPQAMLPCIRPSSEIYGATKDIPGLPDGIPVCGIAGDQQAALFGQACFQAGQVKCTYGTGAFVLMNTGQKLVRSQSGLLTTVGWKINDQVVYALEGSVFIAGAAVQWLRDGLGIISSAPQIQELAETVDSTDGVAFVPALVGLGAPRWNPDARGVITGITRGTTKAHLCRAALEGIAFQVRDVVEAMRNDSGDQVAFFRVDGGAAANDLLLQFQADINNVEIHRPKVIETTALGAALLAGLAAGVWKDIEELKSIWKFDKTFKPQMNPADIQVHLERWEAAVKRA
jgi:glycerol kinase